MVKKYSLEYFSGSMLKMKQIKKVKLELFVMIERRLIN